jgi:hypothetical protein
LLLFTVCQSTRMMVCMLGTLIRLLGPAQHLQGADKHKSFFLKL